MKRAITLFALLLAVFARADDQILSSNIDRTDVNLFIPDGIKPIRAVLINPADKNVGQNTVWGESCRHWEIAHMGVMMENVDKRNIRPRTITPRQMSDLIAFLQKFQK